MDRIQVRLFGDGNVLFANLLAGDAQVFLNSAISINLGFLLKDQWDQNSEGSVRVASGNPWFLESQWRPGIQLEPAIWEPRVRSALYQALDREALSEGLFSGHSEFAAYSILPPSSRNYEATKDTMRRYAYDPARAAALLREAGWAPGAEGRLRNLTDGRVFRTSLRGTPERSNEIAALADFWRRIGIDVEEMVLTPAQYRDARTRATFTGWYSTTRNGDAGLLVNLQGVASSAETGWVGNNSGYDSASARVLIDQYRSAMGARESLHAMRSINDLFMAELPLLVTWFNGVQVGARRNVVALDDFEGGAANLGTFTRNAHLWDMQQR